MNRQSIPNSILMTADTIGGVWTYATELCKALNKYDVQVHLATMGTPLSIHQKEMVAKITNMEIHESTYALEWMKNPWKEIDEAGKWLLALEREIQPDIIHLNNYVHGDLPWRAPVLVTGHSCVLSWWQAVKGAQAPPEWNIYKNRVKKGLGNSLRVVSVSECMLSELEKFYGPFSETEVIYNGRDSKLFEAGEKQQIIFSMGRIWDEAKNISSLQKVAGNVAWPVYVAGDSGEKSAPELENVIMLGKISQANVSEWLEKAAIYVLPARYEPFGLSILEAALSGCALVLGDIPTLREIWGDAAVYANPENPKELEYKIQELTENSSKLKNKAKEARERALCFSLDRFGEKYFKLYQKMIRQNELILTAEST